MNREELGQVVRRAWVRWAKSQENPKESWLKHWEELDEPDKEVDRQIGEAVQKAVLTQFAGQAIAIEEDGITILMPTKDIKEILEFLDKHQPDNSFERPHILNLARVIRSAVNGYKGSELNALAKLKSFKEDVLTYLRAIALVAETVGNAVTHKEKDARLRGLISQIESAIQKVRDEQEHFVYSHWTKPDLFRSDYPIQRYLEKIRELELENKKLKGEPVSPEEEGMF